MKRLTFKVLAIMVMLVMLTSTAFAATATTYTAAETFYTTAPGANEVWFYQYDDGTGYKNHPKVFEGWGLPIWVMAEDPNAGPYANVNLDSETGKMMLHPDRNADQQPINVAVAFKAPADGTVVIPETTVQHFGYGDADDSKGTKVWIEFGTEKYNEVALGYEATAPVAGKTLEVKKGDMVRFVANNNGRGGNNNTNWDINLAFTPTAAAAPTATENPKTGDNGILLYGLLALMAVMAIAFVVPKKATNK